MGKWLFAALLLSLTGNFILGAWVANLEYEKDLYQWKMTQCRKLLDDPITRAIMGVKWKRATCPSPKR